MKRLLTALLTCLLLCGCVRTPPLEGPAATASPAQTSLSAASPAGTYAPDSALERETGGAVRVYPLPIAQVCGIRTLDDGLLVFYGSETTTITLLTGETLCPGASVCLDFYLDHQDPSIATLDGEFTYFDPINRQSVVLDGNLREVSHIAAPEGLVGTPILSRDRNILYYCTATAIRAWDLETGIRRVIRELSYSQQAVTGLLWDDTVLQCTITDAGRPRTLLVNIENGRLLQELPGDFSLRCASGRYYASFSAGAVQTLLFGDGSGDPQYLLPEDMSSQCVLLPRSHAAVSISDPSDGRTALTCYDLNTGTKCAAISLDEASRPSNLLDGGSGSVYFLAYSSEFGRDAICRWTPYAQTSPADTTVYTGTYYTSAAPDTAGLAGCRSYAYKIGAKYGIEVLLYDDAVCVQPWDYTLEAEHRVPVLRRELELLDQRLSQYPAELLKTTAAHFTGFKICIVQQLTGASDSGGLSTATGLQFFHGTDSYIALAVGRYSAQALYHELLHTMETHLWANTTAFDRWEDLNPTGFSYDYDYRANAQRDAGVYLHDKTRAFIDTYSMSFPKEDRARIMEYAMLPGNADLFRAPILQAKLQTLCEGIREAYSLRKSSETFLWEQYLQTPLAAPQ